MLKGIALASALALGLAAPARADEVRVTNTPPARAEVVEVQSSRPNPVSTIVADGLGGAVLGAAAGGGVALYNRYGTNNGNGDWGNWQRDIAVGAGIGLGVGLIVGAVSATTSANADRAPSVAVVDQKSVGFAPPAGQYGMRF